MLRQERRVRRGLFGAALCVALGAPAASQQQNEAQPKESQQASDPQQAVEAWLASDHTSDQLMAETVKAVLEDPKVGLPLLGRMLPMVTEKPDAPRSKGLRSLLVQVTLEHPRRTYKSGMTFVGQYDGLKALQPWVGEFVMDLLLETPEWYPFTFRVRLVPALRDLQLRLPSDDRVAAIVALIQDDREPTDLRHALAAAMWQWGEKKYAERFVRDLLQATTEGDGEDRINATLNLADYYNRLRDYARAAAAHRTA
ncbi:MAG: hypothetical protein KAI24_23250, partial [Planctomycetes bacterium]|nr:hypothetical protein [Planctomycetota bacterium]